MKRLMLVLGSVSALALAACDPANEEPKPSELGPDTASLVGQINLAQGDIAGDIV